MDRLWSPWRSQHVATYAPPPPGSGSVFSRLAAADPALDPEHLIVWRGERVFVVMNLYPYNNGHLLLVPYEEVDAYDRLDAATLAELSHTTQRAMGWLRAALQPHGFNIGLNQGAAGGAAIPEHVHLHIVPRWHGDTNFMPVLSEVKVVPEAMAETYAKLRAALDAEAQPR